jgi:hypothetical protein
MGLPDSCVIIFHTVPELAESAAILIAQFVLTGSAIGVRAHQRFALVPHPPHGLS